MIAGSYCGPIQGSSGPMLKLISPSSAGDMEFTKLPTDCLRLIVSHLSHPRDVVNVGQADMRLHRVSEENWVWRDLTQHHYGEVHLGQSEIGPCYTDSWKQIFMQEYKESRGKLKGEMFRAVCLCKTCSYVYWKDYGHPCSGAQAPSDPAATTLTVKEQEQGLTAEQFIHLFIH